MARAEAATAAVWVVERATAAVKVVERAEAARAAEEAAPCPAGMAVGTAEREAAKDEVARGTR